MTAESQTEQTESQEERPQYDPDDPETWRDPDTRIAEMEANDDTAACTVPLETLGRLTPSQIEALKRIREAVFDGTRHESFRIVQFDVEVWESGRAYVRIKGRRHDCDRYSQRAVFTEAGGFFKLGRQGKITPMRDREDIPKYKMEQSPLIFGIRSGLEA